MKFKLSTVLFVLLSSTYIIFTLFIFTPILAGEISRNLMILIVSAFAAAGQIASSYLLRNEHPSIWVVAFPFEVAIICILSIINNSHIIDSLEFYGIYSIYTAEKDVVLRAVPFYIDAILFALFTFSAREVVFTPIYMYCRNKNSNAVTTVVASEEEN